MPRYNAPYSYSNDPHLIRFMCHLRFNASVSRIMNIIGTETASSSLKSLSVFLQSLSPSLPLSLLLSLSLPLHFNLFLSLSIRFGNCLSNLAICPLVLSLSFTIFLLFVFVRLFTFAFVYVLICFILRLFVYVLVCLNLRLFVYVLLRLFFCV